MYTRSQTSNVNLCALKTVDGKLLHKDCSYYFSNVRGQCFLY